MTRFRLPWRSLSFSPAVVTWVSRGVTHTVLLNASKAQLLAKASRHQCMNQELAEAQITRFRRKIESSCILVSLFTEKIFVTVVISLAALISLFQALEKPGGWRAGLAREKGKVPPSLFLFCIPLIARPCFPGSPLTGSLEQDNTTCSAYRSRVYLHMRPVNKYGVNI